MLLSLNLFHSFFEQYKNWSLDDLTAALNRIGIEVESIKHPLQLNNVVVGRIIKVTKHPNSEKLNYCEVEVADNEILHIVCGAKNVRDNLKVVVAKIGAVLPNDFAINPREIRGIKSEGMICSYIELNPFTPLKSKFENDGIIELDDSASLNDDPLELVGLTDTILDLSTPANRHDLDCVLGIGFDLNELFFPKHNLDIAKVNKNLKRLNEKEVAINLKNKELVNFISFIKINAKKHIKSSWKLKATLINHNIAPTSYLVDLTNLIMLLTSNPLHVYSGDKLKSTFDVGLNESQLAFLALDNKKYELKPSSSLVITQNNSVLALAGIIGSNEYKVLEESDSYVFEIGNFNHELIHNTALKINCITQASANFSKRINIFYTLKAIELLINFLPNESYEITAFNFTDFEIENKKIKLDLLKIKTTLGFIDQEKEIISYLNEMGYKTTKDEVVVEYRRSDLNTSLDIAEELVKKIDLNKIEAKPILNTAIDFEVNHFEQNKEKLESYFLNNGFAQLKTINLTSKEINNDFNFFGYKKNFVLKNPSSIEKSVLRKSLIFSHLNAIKFNLNRKNDLVNTFEIEGINTDENWNQHLVICLSTKCFNNHLNSSNLTVDLLYLKALILNLSKLLNTSFEFRKITELSNDVIVNNNAVWVYENNKKIGILAQVSPLILEKYDIQVTGPIYFVEMNITKNLFDPIKNDFLVAKPREIHPVQRSITIVDSKNLGYKSIVSLIKNKILNVYITSFDIEDVFIKENTSYYTFNFEILNKQQKSLTSEFINQNFEEIKTLIEQNNYEIN